MTQIPYIREKITQAAEQLMTGIRIKDRLREAGHLLIAANLNTDGLDPRIRDELESIIRDLTKRGKLDDTLYGMRMKTAQKIASRISLLDAMVDDL